MSKNTNLSFLTDYITADITNGRIGINNASPTVAFDVTGTGKFSGVLTLGSTISNGTYAYTLPSATGTLALTSALSGYLPLTGGTLTGALGGTSATFSSSGLPLTLSTSASRTDQLVLTQGANTQKSHLGNFAGNTYLSMNWYYNSGNVFDDNTLKSSSIVLNADGSINLNTNNVANTTPSTTFALASTGAATFSSSVTIEGNGSTIRSGNELRFNRTDNAIYTRMYDAGSGAANGFIFDNTNGEGFHFKNTTTTLMRMNSAGNVGIGTSSPVDYTNYRSLHISGATSTSSSILYLTNSTSSIRGLFYAEANQSRVTIGSQSNHDLTLITNDTERMRITSGGNMALGTTTADVTGFGWTTLTIKGGTISGSAGVLELQTPTTNTNGQNIGVIAFLDGSNRNAQISVQRNTSTSTANILFYTNAGAGIVEQMKILTNGNVNVKTRINVGIGDNASNYLFMTENEIGRTGNADFFIQANNTGKTMMNVSGGNILMGTQSDNGERLYVSGNIRATGSITANSDITLKKNLLKIENALEKVEQINGYTYEFKDDDSKRHAGVIAQEIQTVLPEIVNKGNDGILGVEYGNISALLIEAIKEQQTQIKELSTEINLLKQK